MPCPKDEVEIMEVIHIQEVEKHLEPGKTVFLVTYQLSKDEFIELQMKALATLEEEVEKDEDDIPGNTIQ